MFDGTSAQEILSKVQVEHLLVLGAVIIGLILITKGISLASWALARKYPQKRMRVLAWVPLLNFTIYFVGIATACHLTFRPTREVLLGFAASGLLAIGFALKDVLASIIAGVILLVDKPFQEGDRITFGDTYGEVISIGLRSVKLLTLDDDLVTIPNNRFIQDAVSSGTAGHLGLTTKVDIFLKPAMDTELAQTVLERVAAENSHVAGGSKPVVEYREVLGSGGQVTMRMRVEVTIKDARSERDFRSSFVRAANNALKASNILR